MNIQPVINKDGTISFFQVRDDSLHKIIFTIGQLDAINKLIPKLINDAEKQSEIFFVEVKENNHAEN